MIRQTSSKPCLSHWQYSSRLWINGTRCKFPPSSAASKPFLRRKRACHSKSNSNVAERPSLEDPQTPSPDGDRNAITSPYLKARNRQWVKTAYLKATKQHRLQIEEKGKPLAEYMALPASQYSVLDARKIERLDDDTFRCHVGGLKFFGIKVEPVLTVSVVVGGKGPTVKLLSTRLEGSSVVQAANDRFDATMTNIVTWNDLPDSDQSKELESSATIQVALEVPGWMRAFPVGAIEKTGSSVMQRVLNRMLPKFLSQLEADYELWASGDSSRTPIGTGQL